MYPNCTPPILCLCKHCFHGLGARSAAHVAQSSLRLIISLPAGLSVIFASCSELYQVDQQTGVCPGALLCMEILIIVGHLCPSALSPLPFCLLISALLPRHLFPSALVLSHPPQGPEPSLCRVLRAAPAGLPNQHPSTGSSSPPQGP
eukprot:195214-Chlamydomonas_euryale.AAC.1